MTVREQKSGIQLSLKTLAQVVFIIYVFALYVFSFQEKFVSYTEYVFFGFAGLVILHVVAKGKLLLTKAHYCMLLFCFASFLSGLWAIDTSLAMSTSISLTILAVMSILVYQVFEKKDVDKLLKAIVFAGVALVIYTAIDVGVSEYFSSIFTGERLGGTMNAANTFGVYCSISLVAGVYLFRKNKWLYALALIIMLSGILASASRNAFIIASVGVIVSLLFAFKNSSLGRKAFYLVLFAILVFVLYKLGYFDNIFSRFEDLDMDAAVEAGEEVDPSFGSRLFMIRFGFSKFFSKPLWGYGAANAQLLLEKVWAKTYLHNNYVELLVNVGLIGFALYYAMHVLVLKGLFKNRRKPLDACEALIALLIVLLLADMSIVFYYNKLTYIVLTAAMLLNKKGAEEEEEEPAEETEEETEEEIVEEES